MINLVMKRGEEDEVEEENEVAKRAQRVQRRERLTSSMASQLCRCWELNLFAFPFHSLLTKKKKRKKLDKIKYKIEINKF